MIKATEIKVITTRRTMRAEITGEQLRLLVPGAPYGAEVYIQVPGGGDWSNAALEIDSRNPVIITWTEVEEA